VSGARDAGHFSGTYMDSLRQHAGRRNDGVAFSKQNRWVKGEPQTVGRRRIWEQPSPSSPHEELSSPAR
jgi:hypothetical protein